MRSRSLLGALAALAMLATPAAASPPGAHDRPVGGCGFLAMNTDPADPASTHFEGEVDCEVLFLNGDDPTVAPTTRHAVVTATLQTSFTPDSEVVASCAVTSTLVGFAVVGACTISLTVAPSQGLWFCVHYSWIEPAGAFTYWDDSEPVAAGDQCYPPI